MICGLGTGMSNQSDGNLDIDLGTFASLVEQDHNDFMTMVNGADPTSQMLRGFFSDEFIAEKDAEMCGYVDGLRAIAEKDGDNQ